MGFYTGRIGYMPVFQGGEEGMEVGVLEGFWERGVGLIEEVQGFCF